MLLGTYTPKLDDKGRVILPAKFRTDLGDGVVVTRGQERCLYVFSTKEFERVYEKIREAPLTNKQARDFQRMFLSGASDGVAEIPGLQDKLIRLAKGGFKHHTSVAPGHLKAVLKEAFTTYLPYDWVDIDG